MPPLAENSGPNTVHWCSPFNVALILVGVLALLAAIIGPRYKMGTDDVTDDSIDGKGGRRVLTEEELIQVHLAGLEKMFDEKLSTLQEQIRQQLSELVEETIQMRKEDSAMIEKLAKIALGLKERLQRANEKLEEAVKNRNAHSSSISSSESEPINGKKTNQERGNTERQPTASTPN